MDCIDFHTHHPSREGERVIQDGLDTWGIHPWHVGEPYTPPANAGGLLAIGECGLDPHSPAPLEEQRRVLEWQLHLAGEWHLPVILHCVKSIDPLIALRKAMRPHEAWVLHGFRGKPQQLQSLVSAGFHVSFGFRYNPASLLACPMERLLLETDDDPRPVRLLYQEVASLRDISPDSLCQAMQGQFSTLFAPQPHTTEATP